MSTAADISLSDRIRVARERASLSQVELAARLGVSPRTLQNWESGVLPQPRHRRSVLAFIDEHEGQAA